MKRNCFVVLTMAIFFSLVGCDTSGDSSSSVPPHYTPSGDTPLTVKRIEDLGAEVGWASGNAITAGKVSADDEAGSIFQGLYSQDQTGALSGRKLYLYVSPTVRYRQGQVLIAMPSGVDVTDFLYDTGWMKIADDRRMSLLIAEAGGGGAGG
ncbi:hypothetical protein AGMMS50293_26320 [Spirochaetia bacterium]|nr:hypothetical protein AGMMS50293_26320 [Spirochaetia bacterium]